MADNNSKPQSNFPMNLSLSDEAQAGFATALAFVMVTVIEIVFMFTQA